MLFGHLEGKQGSHLGGSIARKGRFSRFWRQNGDFNQHVIRYLEMYLRKDSMGNRPALAVKWQRAGQEKSAAGKSRVSVVRWRVRMQKSKNPPFGRVL
ncbi:TPA: hypothetical protein MIP64_01405 [Klebsiella pneumoniae]|nr:hypothetical protein A9P89_16965 [Klebsiella pneumoniae]HBY1083590.1 hypothetical protein [Klebsiella pneumoniae]HBY5170286.1 hypothetical protein [Klebsiella pneumoniae]